MTSWRLVVDVGGTNARFARATGGVLGARRSYNVRQFESFIDALAAYLDETGGASGCVGAAIGAAGPVDSGIATLTNAHWRIDAREISLHLNVPAAVVNDLEAAAFSLPGLSAAELRFLGDPAVLFSNPSRLLAANVGTGFGAATLIRAGGSWISCPSEAGHMTFAKASEAEASLPARFASVEHILSGGGLTELYISTAPDAMEKVSRPSAAEILGSVKADRAAAASVEYFTVTLGRVLGDLVLATAAWHGVFLFGSVARGWADVADLDLFRRVFENKGAMTPRMKRVPIALVLQEDAALAGLAFMPLSSSPC